MPWAPRRARRRARSRTRSAAVEPDMFFYYDWTILLLIPGMLLGLWAQHRVAATYRKYADVPSSTGMTGRDMAKAILRNGGLSEVQVESTPGQLSDHYDPARRTVR